MVHDTSGVRRLCCEMKDLLSYDEDFYDSRLGSSLILHSEKPPFLFLLLPAWVFLNTALSSQWDNFHA